MIRPPPGPPPLSPRERLDLAWPSEELGRAFQNRPEEPAKYINELPKLVAADLGSSAVACGNWIAQIRQIFVGISPSADAWWGSVERASTLQYQKWIVADPVDRLILDPALVVADFDVSKYQRVESRAVSLILAALPQPLRDEAVSNRWLTSAALLFRVQCVYQPGGSSERSMLLTSLVAPESAKTFSGAVTMLRKWQQHFHRVKELHASLPDSSLLLRGVDAATTALLVQNPQLGFRVNTFRNRVSLDYNPTISGVLQLVRLLQAEFESAALSSESAMPDKKARAASMQQVGLQERPKAPPPKASGPDLGEARARVLEGQAEPKGKGKGKDKGKEAPREVGLCHGFSGAAGCKYGDSCKFKHDRVAAKKERRCMACGLEGHFRSECPTGSPEARGLREIPSGSQSSSGPGSRGPPVPKAKAGFQVKGVQEDSGEKGALEGAQTSGTSSASEALMAEAAKLLKGISLKPLRTESEGASASLSYSGDLCINQGWLLSAVASASDPLFALVDSGATNALRQAEEGEILQARVIRVDLASGATELHVNEFGTLLSTKPCQVILPACYLVQLGYVISWKKKGCSIKRKGEASLQVKVVKGCPLVPKEKGLQLLAEYEGLKGQSDLPSLRNLRDTPVEPLKDIDLRVWLARRVGEGLLSRQDQIRWMLSMFPEVPYDYVCAAAGSDADPECLSAEGAPWNRRKRRSIARAKRGEVLLHLFAGSQRWRCPGRVVEVEKSRGSDLMSHGVFQHVLCWGIKGVIGGVVGGPPCRSVSCCRSATDGGPPPVRDRYGSRWGLADLPGHWKQMVKSDRVLWLRFLLAYAVAQASSDVAVLIPDLNQSGGDQVEVDSCNQRQVQTTIQTLPQGVDDPVELARWALSEAVKRLHGRRESGYHLPKESVKPVFFVWEHPADPETYLSKTFAPEGGWPSWWAFDEWRCFAATYDLHLARLDQGRYGHIRPKPTGLATSSWFLYERLHGQVLSEAETKAFGRGPRSVEHRIAEAPGWASWAPGLTRCVLEAWILWGQEQGLWSEVQDRRAYVLKLTEQEMQRRHENQDHVPFRKGCPVCIGAQGRQRSHWRASVKAVYSASFDIAGPFKPGRSFDATVSGRDKGGGYKYFLACAFMVPLVRAPGTLVGAPADAVTPVDPNLDLPDMTELFPEGVAGVPELEPAPEAMGKAVRFRIREKRSEDLAGLSSGVIELPDAAPPLPPPAGEPPKDGAIAVATRLLCMGTPLRSKKGREVCGAVQAMINQLEAFGFPVHRYHADRAQELKSKQLLAWLRDKGIHTTWTPGDTPAPNRAEVAVQQLKSQSRKLLHAAQLGVEFWPLALLHASTRHWSLLANDLGIVQPVLLPFGLRLQARKRQKTGYSSHWTTRTVPGQYVGRAPNTPGGHLVLVAQDSGDNKVLLTNTVYPVRDSGSEKPRFRVKGKTSPEFLLRPVYAWHFPSLAEAPPPPRGEWDGGDASAVVYEFWPRGECGCVNARSEDQQNCEESNAPTGQQVLRENSAPKWQQVLEQDGAPVRLQTLEVAKSEGKQPQEESNAPSWQQVLRENNAPTGQQVLEQDGAPARLRTLWEVEDRTSGDESTQEENTLEEVEQWEVDVPFELVDGLWVEGALALSEAAAYACTTSVRQICRSRAEPEIGMNLEGFNRAVRERAWIEEVLVQLQDSAESSAKVRSLAAEVSLGDSVPTAPEQFLQTRTVSLDEARRELDLWYDAGKEEVEALEVTTRAVERVDSSLVDEWILEGKKVVQVPGKAVLTRKSGVGKRRLRAVCCGNHLPASATGDKADLYAGGVDALTVRVVLGYSAQFLDWTVCVLDIKTAFLNAPARSSSEGDENGPIIVVKPPYLLVQLGLMEVGQRWRVRRALYGLQTSPRDWAVYRDAEMRAMVVQTEEPSTFTQSQTDDSMWLVRTKKGNVLGLIVVYVDDIAVFGTKGVTQKVAETFMAKWKTSTPLWPSPTEPVSFCGMEVARLSDGWRITQ